MPILYVKPSLIFSSLPLSKCCDQPENVRLEKIVESNRDYAQYEQVADPQPQEKGRPIQQDKNVSFNKKYTGSMLCIL